MYTPVSFKFALCQQKNIYITYIKKILLILALFDFEKNNNNVVPLQKCVDKTPTK